MIKKFTFRLSLAALVLIGTVSCGHVTSYELSDDYSCSYNHHAHDLALYKNNFAVDALTPENFPYLKECVNKAERDIPECK